MSEEITEGPLMAIFYSGASNKFEYKKITGEEVHHLKKFKRIHLQTIIDKEVGHDYKYPLIKECNILLVKCTYLPSGSKYIWDIKLDLTQVAEILNALNSEINKYNGNIKRIYQTYPEYFI